MKLHEFQKQAHQELSIFVEYWERMHDKEPEYFPLDMDEGEWYEHFAMFDDSSASDVLPLNPSDRRYGGVAVIGRCLGDDEDEVRYTFENMTVAEACEAWSKRAMEDFPDDVEAGKEAYGEDGMTITQILVSSAPISFDS